ncbi:MAG: diadenylate cyclase CdaA [Eubacteriales bacterium]|nr:diadenylate cyclase CdaA [Eubacteriales bacterium]
MNTGDLLTDLGQFVRSLFSDLTSGLLFFGGPVDILMAALDIIATSLVVYYILKLLRDTRAWQLLKGLAMIIGFALICSLLGLTTVGFLLNNTISVFAIAFVVIFQPELRRALETVGRSSFSVLSTALASDDTEQTTRTVHHMIESIVRACDKMAATRTGALIIIERQTKLGEFLEQENAVQLDAAVSATMLQQIFYKGSPLHDGAVVIRDGRISAARVHVPLSDNYHLRRDYGTRHRAAIGASEIGDTLAVVVSEERGSISLALEGRLFILDNADALRSLLHKMLGAPKQGGTWTGIFRPRRDEPAAAAVKNQAKAAAAVAQTSAESARAIIESQLSHQQKSPGPESGSSVPGKSRLRWPIRIGRQRDAVDRPKMPRRQRVLTALASLLIAVVIWLYVQVTINPVISRTFSTQVSYRGVETARSNGFIVQMPLETVQITLMGRQKTINDLSVNDINAYIDLSDLAQTGLQSLAVAVDTSSLSYTRATFVTPSTITVSVRAVEGS